MVERTKAIAMKKKTQNYKNDKSQLYAQKPKSVTLFKALIHTVYWTIFAVILIVITQMFAVFSSL